MRITALSHEYINEFWTYVDNIEAAEVSDGAVIRRPYSGWVLQNAGRIQGAMLIQEDETHNVLSMRCDERLGCAGYVCLLLFAKELAEIGNARALEYTYLLDARNGGVDGALHETLKMAMQISGFEPPEYKTAIFRVEGAAVMGKASAFKRDGSRARDRVVPFYSTSVVQREKINAGFGKTIPKYLDYTTLRNVLPEYSFAVLGEDNKIESFLICTGKGAASGMRKRARDKARFMNYQLQGADSRLLERYKQESTAEPEEIEVSALYAPEERKLDFSLLLYHALISFQDLQDRRSIIIINALNPKIKVFVEKLFPVGISGRSYLYGTRLELGHENEENPADGMEED